LADSIPGDDDWIELHNTSAALPVSLQGIYLAAGDELSRLQALSVLPPLGYARIWADEGAGPDHADFRLPAAGGEIRLYDPTGALVDEVPTASKPKASPRDASRTEAPPSSPSPAPPARPPPTT
jgi:hypothetical protein